MSLRSSLVRSLLFAVAVGSLAGACTGRTTTGGGGAIVTRPAPAPIDRARVKAALAERRKVTFARFLAYREARVYPVNPGPGTRHLWIDAEGHLCAAATIISGDWGRDATVAAAAADLGVALADVHDGRLAAWMLTSGLTHAELVAIQVPGFAQPEPVRKPDARTIEIARLYQIYVDVECQLTGLWDEDLEHAVDALMARPELARAFASDPEALVASLSPFARDLAAAPAVAFAGIR